MKLYKLYEWDFSSNGNRLEKNVKSFILQYDNGLTFISSYKLPWRKINCLTELIETIKGWSFMTRGVIPTDEDILIESSPLEYLLIKGSEGSEELNKLIEEEGCVKTNR
jgi:hypothetical protein